MLANAFARVRTTPQPDTYATIDSPPPVEYKEEDETVDHVASASSRLPGHQRRLSLSLNLVQGGSPLLAPPSPKLGNFGAAARPTTRYFVLAVIALAVSAASFLLVDEDEGTASAELSCTVCTHRLAGHSGASPGTCRIDNSIERQFGRWNVKLSRAHEGSGYRMKRFWEKVERGEAVNVAVLGGSGAYKSEAVSLAFVKPRIAHVCPRTVSTGHGAIGKHLYQYGAIPADQIWHAVVGKWLNDTVGADRVRFVSGSAGGMDSGFFSWCWPAKMYVFTFVLAAGTLVLTGFTFAAASPPISSSSRAQSTMSTGRWTEQKTYSEACCFYPAYLRWCMSTRSQRRPVQGSQAC